MFSLRKVSVILGEEVVLNEIDVESFEFSNDDPHVIEFVRLCGEPGYCWDTDEAMWFIYDENGELL